MEDGKGKMDCAVLKIPLKSPVQPFTCHTALTPAKNSFVEET
jgi:hypothetical protein